MYLILSVDPVIFEHIITHPSQDDSWCGKSIDPLQFLGIALQSTEAQDILVNTC